MTLHNQKLKSKVLKYGILLGIIGGFLATLKSLYLFKEAIGFMLPLTMTLLLIFYYYLYKKRVDTTLLAFLTIVTVFIEILLKEQFTNVGMGIYFWIYIFPLAIFAFFTPLKSLMLNLFFMTTFLLVHYDGMGTINPDYFLFPLAFSYFSITIFNFIYQRYQDKQAEVIAEKTIALNHLNHTLQDKITLAIQENKSKDKVLAQQAKLAQMGELLSMISHQWRQPLGSIASATISLKTKIALEKYDLSKEDEREAFLTYLGEKLDHIEQYTTSLSSTIDDFKNFYNPHKEIIDTSIMIAVQKAIDILQSSFDNHHITLKIDAKESVTLQHYPNEIMQVMLNILNNAVGNFKEKESTNPTIMIGIKEDQTHIMIEIEDNGGGINPEIIDKIFDPYFSTKDEKNGTGLGLYMSKTIIEKHHHGILSVKNSEHGACFSISLPKKLPTQTI